MTIAHYRAGVTAVLFAALLPQAARADDTPPAPASTPTKIPLDVAPAVTPSVTGDPELVPRLDRPIGDAGNQRQAIATLERLYRDSGEGDLLLSIARLHEQVAKQGGDERDKRLAILYYERYLAEKGARADWIAVKAALVRLGLKPRAAEALPDRVKVHFLSYRDQDIYQVKVGDHECTTPCTMVVPTGPVRVHTEGSANIRLQLVAPRLSSQIRLQHDDSRGYTVTGAVLVPAGLVTAASMWALGFACPRRSDACVIANFAGWPIVGLVNFITGVVLLSAAPKHQVAADANRFEILDVRAPTRLRLTGIGVAPMPGGATAGVAFAF